MDNNAKVIDLNLSDIKKQRIRINGDDSKIVEINLSDMGVMDRLQHVYNKLVELANQYHLDNEDEETDTAIIIEQLKSIDAEMRKLVDYTFNANVSAICAEDGTMADPINGQFRFEYIIEKFLGLYDMHFTAEFKKMSAKVNQRTKKYTRK